MQFDLIITNPPYHKGTIKKYHDLYHHKAMNGGREGTIGFLLKCLDYLKSHGLLIYVTPIKFLRGPGCSKTREYLFQHFKLKSVVMKDPKIFKGFGVDKIGVHTWSTGITETVDVDGVTIDPYKMPDLIVPAFETQEIADQYVTDIQNGLLGRPIGGPKPANNKYKVVFEKTFLRKFRLETPGYALGFYENCYEYDSEQDAIRLLESVSQMVFAKTWSAIQPGRDSHVVPRYLPYYDPIKVSRHSYTVMQYLPHY